MNHFTFVTTILILCLTISNSEAAPTQRGLQGRLRHHREDLTLDPSGNEPSIAGEREPKEAGGNLQEKEELDEREQQRQVVREMKDLLKQLRQLGRWTVKVKGQKSSPETQEQDSMTRMGLSFPRAGDAEARNYQLYKGRGARRATRTRRMRTRRTRTRRTRMRGPERGERERKGQEREGPEREDQNVRTRTWRTRTQEPLDSL